MPLISSFYGILIYIYFRDHNPLHIHAKYGEFEAMIEMQNGRIIKGDIPKRAHKLILDWIEINKSDVLQNWELAKAGQIPKEINPLD